MVRDSSEGRVEEDLFALRFASEDKPRIFKDVFEKPKVLSALILQHIQPA